MPRSRGWTWQRWYECSMCGFDYPESKTAFWKGRRRCTVLCQDLQRNEDEDTTRRVDLAPASPGGRNGTNTT